MTENEYSSLKKGDIVTKGEQYFVVFDTFDDNFIDTQELGDIGKENEFGFTHTNLNFNYTEIVSDTDVITAINKWLELDSSDVEPYSFIVGFKSAKNVSERG